MRSQLLRIGFAATAAVGSLMLLAAPASAHALLQSSAPVDGEVLTDSPTDVRLTFSESVSLAPGAVRVFADDGTRVATQPATTSDQAHVVHAELAAGLGQGTHIVTYRVTSADGHPVAGALLFSVGAAGNPDRELLAELFDQQAAPATVALAALARWLLYGGVLIAVGGIFFVRYIHDGRSADRRAYRRTVLIAASVALLGTLLSVAGQAALVSGGGFEAVAQPAILSSVAASGFGWSAIVRGLGLTLLLLGVRAGWTGVAQRLSAVGAVATVGSFALTGHTVTAEPVALAVISDIAHVTAAALWTGGLALLLVTLRRRAHDDDALGAARMVARFSTLATGAVVVVAVAGLALAWGQVRATRALWSTAYGWTLMAKVAVVAAILVVAAYNHRRLVPAISGSVRPVPAGGSSDAPTAAVAADPDTASATPPPSGASLPGTALAWRRLRRTVNAEIAGLVIVVALTAVLVDLVPARIAAGVSGPYSTTVPLGNDHQVTLTVDPNQAGINEFHFYLLDDTGRPAGATDELTVLLSLPAQQIGPLERFPSISGPGHWTMRGPELSIPGRWRMQLSAPLSRFDDATADIEFVVGG